MSMTRTFLLVVSLLIAIPTLFAQEAEQTTAVVAVNENKPTAADVLHDWDTETLIDSLDQELLPRLVTTGVILNANLSNFIITRDHNTMSSYMRVGLEVGGFVDFRLSKHFAIEPQFMITAEQNRFSTDSAHSDMGLWQVGCDIPIYFLGRFGNMQKGYLNFGGGIFVHCQFASNVGSPIVVSNNGLDVEKEQQRQDLQDEYKDLLKLHNNHFGVCATVGYEFPIGIQINLAYRVSLSDICSYYVDGRKSEDEKVKELAQAAIYPQKLTIGVAYRIKSKAEYQHIKANKSKKK